MRQRRSEYDVTDSVKTTDAAQVAAEVRRIYLDLFRKADVTALDRSFVDLTALYAGENPRYRPCDTSYHDMQHVMDVTLAMARLMHGYKRAGRETLDARLFSLGIVLALFHDCGYIRHRNDSRHANGAEYTLSHVTRGARYLRNYLPQIGLADFAQIGPRVIHFTGYEVPVAKIRLKDPVFRVMGNLLGSADILAQMADRCYLEKCHDRLFPEFELGGIARRRNASGEEEIVFASAADLIAKTPGFYESAAHRLDDLLEGAYRYVEPHFGGHNHYVTAVEQNITYARKLSAPGGKPKKLRRRPPRVVPAAQGHLEFS
jgi:hypothetical protein